MIRIGVISNPRSRRNKRDGRAIAQAAARHPDVRRAELPCMAALPAILAGFAAEGVSVLAVDGGDGTVQAVMTALLTDSPFRAPPLLALIPSGTTNLIAEDAGVRGRRSDALDRLAGAGPDDLARHTIALPVMRLERADAAPVYGMFFGAAAICRAMGMARRSLHPLGLAQSAAIGAAIPAALARSLFGAERRVWAAGERATVAADGTPVLEGRAFLIMATTLRRLTFGLEPFWGEGTGDVRYLSVTAPPVRLASALLPTLRGRPRAWMEKAGYRSGRALRLDLTVENPVALDGEFFDPGPDGRIALVADRSLSFVRL